jgi:hypothetical protein
MGKFGSRLVMILLLSGWGSSGALAAVIKCIDDQNKIVGGTDADSCRNLLPKCSELKEKYEKSVRDLLSMKIYGYYKGFDLDLNKTTIQTKVGDALPTTVCSLVGHHIVYKPGTKLEFHENRNEPEIVGNGGKNEFTGAPCGARPKMGAQGAKLRLVLNFSGGEGDRWRAVMLGGMPYAVRAAAYEFFQNSANVGTVDASLNSSNPTLTQLKGELLGAQSQMSDYFNKLPANAKAACTDEDHKQIVDSCLGITAHGAPPLSLTDPARRLCSLVKAQSALSVGALGSLVTAQIMENAQKKFDEHFGDLMKYSGQYWQALKGACAESGDLTCNRRNLSKQASCMHDGKWFYTSDDRDAWEDDNGDERCFLWICQCRKGNKRSAVSLESDSPQVRTGIANPDPTTGSRGGNYTLANGFEGMVEFIIRRKICGQSSVTSPSAKCDESSIPDKPAGIQW